MKRLVLVALLLAGCGGGTTVFGEGTVHGSGHVVSVDRRVGAFRRIELAGAASVHVAVGSAASARVTADDNIVPLVRLRLSGDTLVVSTTRSYSTHDLVGVEITTPTLEASSLSGAGTVVVDGIAAPRFDLVLAGAGTLDLRGTVDTLDARLSGAGSAALQGLRTRDAHVVVSGTGSASVYVTHSLDATVAGVGSVRYAGNPAHVTSHVSGVGSVGPS